MNILEVLKKLKDDLILFITNNLNVKINKENPSGTGSFSMNNPPSIGENAASLNESTATGYDSCAVNFSDAKGESSFSCGYQTTAGSSYQFVSGVLNVEDPDGQYAQIVGNGDAWSADGVPSNAYTLDWDGNGYYAGKVEAYNGFQVGPTQIVYDYELGALRIDFISGSGRE